VVVAPPSRLALPEEQPVVTTFPMNLGIKPADVFQDDDLFYSASQLGASGHPRDPGGTTDAFLLDAYRYYTNFDSLKNAITSFDSRGSTWEAPRRTKLYHFEVMNNIYCDDPKNARW